MCCPDLEALFINCESFYSPREYCLFILTSVYIPPQAHVSLALQKLTDLITGTEQQHPDSVLMCYCDIKFNIFTNSFGFFPNYNMMNATRLRMFRTCLLLIAYAVQK